MIVRYLPEFERRAKLLAKKYKSFIKDYEALLASLEQRPMQGVSLGGGVYKIRMPITSKSKGKSGGARVLTYNVNESSSNRIIITLLTVFDKSELENVSDGYIRSIVKQAKGNDAK